MKTEKMKQVSAVVVVVLALLGGIFAITGCENFYEDDAISGSASVFHEADQTDSPYTVEGDESIPSDYAGIDEGEVLSVVEYQALHADMDTDLYGLHTADSIKENHAAKLEAMRGAVTGTSNDLADIVAAQYMSFTDYIKSDGWSLRDGTTQKRTTQIQTNYYVYSVYSFDNDKDYYIVQQEVIISNGNLWGGMRKKYKFPAYYRSKDFWMSNLWTNNTVSNGKNILGPGVLSISKYSPETINGQTSYTEGFSWNIGGKVGVSNNGKDTTIGGDISGGVSFSNSHTWTVTDIGVTSSVMDDLSTKNAKWAWNTNKKCTYNYSVDINDPADLAKSTARFGASWLWVVDKPGKNDQYTLNAAIGGNHASTSFYSTGADMSQRDYGWSFNHSFVLDKPNRVEQ